jgi:hypothetical protein
VSTSPPPERFPDEAPDDEELVPAALLPRLLLTLTPFVAGVLIWFVFHWLGG